MLIILIISVLSTVVFCCIILLVFLIFRALHVNELISSYLNHNPEEVSTDNQTNFAVIPEGAVSVCVLSAQRFL
jgi:hypothetical protein